LSATERVWTASRLGSGRSCTLDHWAGRRCPP